MTKNQWTPAKARAAERASRARKVASGARRMPGGLLPPDASQALDHLRASGYAPTLTACIARALVAASSSQSTATQEESSCDTSGS